MAYSVDDVRDHYDGLSFGDFSYGDRRAGFYPLFDQFVAMIGPSSRVCDIGCGAGFWLDEMVRRGVRDDQLLGIDLAPGNVRRARERGHHAETGDVLNLQLASNSFDFTFCAGVIHHTPDPDAALRQLVRVTTGGGHIYLAVYNKWHPYFWLVHKATMPLRALHWRGWARTSRLAYHGWRLVVQPASYVAFGRRLDDKTCHALYMDQVLTPYAHLCTRADLTRRAEAAGLDIVGLRFALRSLMIVAILRVRDKQLVAPEQRSCVGG
jgi:SAM-dependent methyltransferase